MFTVVFIFLFFYLTKGIYFCFERNKIFATLSINVIIYILTVAYLDGFG